MAAFLILYGFMSNLLHLDGFTKEIYALIFGFWIRTKKPVCVPYRVIRNITGASDPTISECIKRLVKQGLIMSDPKPGVRTKYSIVFTNEIWSAYLRDSGKNETPKVNEELSPPKHSSHVPPRTAKSSEEHKNIKKIKQGGNATSNLTVPSSYSISTRITTISKPQPLNNIK